MTDELKRHRRRLVSEGAIIVVSILLAFAIDALWAQRQLRVEEAEILVALQSEYKTNLELVERVLDGHERSRQQVETLMGLSDKDVLALPQLTISETMLALANPWTFDAVLGTTDTLVGSGKLGVLHNVELREALTAFINGFEDIAEDAAYMAWFSEQIWLAEVDLGGPWTDPKAELAQTGEIGSLDFIPVASAEDLLRVRGDQHYIGLVKRYYLSVAYYVQELRNIRAQIKLVIEKIERSQDE